MGGHIDIGAVLNDNLDHFRCMSMVIFERMVKE